MARRPSSQSKDERSQAGGWESRLAAGELIHGTLDKGSDLETALRKSRAFDRLEGPDQNLLQIYCCLNSNWIVMQIMHIKCIIIFFLKES
jgi:hypothetical protein